MGKVWDKPHASRALIRMLGEHLGDTVKLREVPKAPCYQARIERCDKMLDVRTLHERSLARGQGNDLGYGNNAGDW